MVILRVLRRDWIVWLIAAATFANGLLSVSQILFTRVRGSSDFFNLIFPFGLFHWSRSLTLVLGFILVYLSFNLLSRRLMAWWMAVFASLLAVLAHLGQLRLWYTALSPALTLTLLVLFRRRFTVRSEQRNIVQGLAFFIISLSIAISYGTIGFWLLHQRDFGISFNITDALRRTLREFVLIGNSDLTAQTRHALWFLESIRILGVVAGIFAIYSLFRPVAYRFRELPQEQAEAKSLLVNHGRSSYDYFKIWPDKSYFFSESRRSFISYKVAMGVAFCLGDPVGPYDDIENALASFLRFCEEKAWLASFLILETVDIYKKLGLSILKIGEEAVVDLEHFASLTAQLKYFRYVKRKFEGEGYQFFRQLPPHSKVLLDEAELVSKGWLSIPGNREFGFAQGRFQRSYIEKTPLFILRDPLGQLVAFINQIPSYSENEATFDLIRHRPGLHWGTMDYLFREVMLNMRQEGFKKFNLGLAPFSGLGQRPGASLTEKAIRQLFEHIDWVVRSKGLRNYKLKFKPVWHERFIAYHGGPIGLAKMSLAINRVL